jgi:hypothetical protein
MGVANNIGKPNRPCLVETILACGVIGLVN